MAEFEFSLLWHIVIFNVYIVVDSVCSSFVCFSSSHFAPLGRPFIVIKLPPYPPSNFHTEFLVVLFGLYAAVLEVIAAHVYHGRYSEIGGLLSLSHTHTHIHTQTDFLCLSLFSPLCVSLHNSLHVSQHT